MLLLLVKHQHSLLGSGVWTEGTTEMRLCLMQGQVQHQLFSSCFSEQQQQGEEGIRQKV